MSTPTTPSGKLHHDADHADDFPCLFGMYGSCDIGDDIAQIEHEAFLAGLDSPEMLELLAGRLFATYGDSVPGPIRHDWDADSESILASMRSSLRAETDR